MSKVKCKDCQYYNEGICETLGEYVTPGEGECYWFVEQKPTVFDKITESVEALAEKLVHFKQRTRDGALWCSNLFRVPFNTKDEAIAATVEELKKEYKK